MRNPTPVFAILFLAALPCCAQIAASLPTTSGPGSTTYHSDTMNFDFDYPSSFHAPKSATDDANAKGTSARSETKKPDPGCISVPIGVMDMRKDFNMIFLKQYDTACLGIEIGAAGLGAATAKFFAHLLEQFGKPDVGSSTDYDLAGHSASTVFGSVKTLHASGKSLIYGAGSCVLSDKNMACFAFLSNDCPTLAILSASRIRFTDAAATPVVPARFLPPCLP